MPNVGDLRNTKLEPRLTNRDLGAETLLNVTVDRERYVGLNVWMRYVRDVREGFNPGVGFTVLNGKLYEIMSEEIWEKVLSEDATVTILWSYGSLSGTVATDIPTNGARSVTVPWTIPTSLAAENMVFDEFAVQFTVQVTDGAYTATWGPDTVVANSRPRVPLGLVPTFIQWGFSEGNAGITPGSPFVPSSVLRASPVFEGTLGAPMNNVTVWFNPIVDATPITTTGSVIRGGTVIPAEGLPLAAPGVFNIGAKGTDARGRWVEATTTLTVAEYTRPSLDWSPQRVNAVDVPDPSGDRIAVELATQVHFLGGLNSHQIRIFTRPFGGSTWVEQEVIDPPGIEYTDTLTLPDVFDANVSWEILVEVRDAVTVLSDTKVIASEGVVIDADRGHVAFGMPVNPDGPRVQLRGPARVYGDIRADNMPVHQQRGVKPAGVSQITVPLTGFGQTPEVTLTVIDDTTTASTAWVVSLTRTQLVIRSSRTQSVVQYRVEEFPWVANMLDERDTPTSYPNEIGSRPVGSLIFVGLVGPATVDQYAYTPIPTTSALYVNASGAVVPNGNTRYQLENGLLVAWYFGTIDSVGRRNTDAAPSPWLGSFRSEIYDGEIPTADAKEITQRLARSLGKTITFGPQFD